MQQISPFYLPTETVTILVEFFFLQLFAVPTGWEESHKFKRFRRAQEELVSSNISLSNPSSWLTVRKNMGRGPVAGRWKTHFAPRGPLRRTGPLKPTRNVIWQPCDLAAEIFFFSSFFDKDLKKRIRTFLNWQIQLRTTKGENVLNFFQKIIYSTGQPLAPANNLLSGCGVLETRQVFTIYRFVPQTSATWLDPSSTGLYRNFVIRAGRLNREFEKNKTLRVDLYRGISVTTFGAVNSFQKDFASKNGWDLYGFLKKCFKCQQQPMKRLCKYLVCGIVW